MMLPISRPFLQKLTNAPTFNVRIEICYVSFLLQDKITVLFTQREQKLMITW